MVRIRAVVNGNIVEESEDQAAFLVDAGLFVYLSDAPEPPPVVVEEPAPEPAPRVRRSRGRR